MIPRFALLLCAAACTTPLAAQITVSPRQVAPTDFVRLAVQVTNPTDTAIVAVQVAVPEALAILGADAPPGWSARITAATDTSPQTIEWSGGQVARRDFREFPFLVRLGANAERTDLVLPVRIRRADGSVRDWRPGGYGPAPVLVVEGTIGITARGAFVLAAAGIGLSALGIGLALRRPH